MIKITTNSQLETIDIGKKIARFLKSGDVIALSGNLGAGKTTLVKGIGQGLGISQKQVNSPSYVLIREYKGKKNSLFHCDLYRLDRIEQISFLGIEDYFERDGIFIIEWAKKAGDLLPDQYLDISIDLISKEKRSFRIKANGERYKQLMEKIKSGLE